MGEGARNETQQAVSHAPVSGEVSVSFCMFLPVDPFHLAGAVAEVQAHGGATVVDAQGGKGACPDIHRVLRKAGRNRGQGMRE